MTWKKKEAFYGLSRCLFDVTSGNKSCLPERVGIVQNMTLLQLRVGSRYSNENNKETTPHYSAFLYISHVSVFSSLVLGKAESFRLVLFFSFNSDVLIILTVIALSLWTFF